MRTSVLAESCRDAFDLAGHVYTTAERDGRRIIVSVLGSQDRYTDAIALFDWAFANTEPACAG